MNRGVGVALARLHVFVKRAVAVNPWTQLIFYHVIIALQQIPACSINSRNNICKIPCYIHYS